MADKRNTLTWALLIWAVSGVGFALFMPFEATMLRSDRGCRRLVRSPPHPQNVILGHRGSGQGRIPAMAASHSKATIISMAIVATGITGVAP